MPEPVHGLKSSRRMIVKVGSALLVEAASAEVHTPWLDALCDELATLRRSGVEVLVVTSGAIALGRKSLGLPRRPHRLDEKQAAAAAGQILLAFAWLRSLERHQITAAQVLLTLEDSDSRRRYLNARDTMETLLRLGAIPVINENDTVATEEIRFGDNDRLAARVAQMVSADTLVLLSDIDGLYTADPRIDPDARLIPMVTELNEEVENYAGVARSGLCTGGMVTKLMAARIALSAGCRMVIAPGGPLRPLEALENGGRCTWFIPSEPPLTARKRWISGSIRPSGVLTVDPGAAVAIRDGKSLLPKGVCQVEGNFVRGDAVRVCDATGKELARGLANFDGDEARLIAGRHSSEIESILGYQDRDELIHRDDLVLS